MKFFGAGSWFKPGGDEPRNEAVRSLTGETAQWELESRDWIGESDML